MSDTATTASSDVGEDSHAPAPPSATWPLPRSCPMSHPAALADFREGPPRQVLLRGDQPAWLITRYADVRRALNEPLLSVDDQHPNWPNRLLFPTPPGAVSFWRMDPPEHGRYRKMVAGEFTAHRTRQMRPLIKEVADGLLDDLSASPRPVDLCQAFALPLPCMVIARIFGVPDEDMVEFKENTGALLNQKEPEKAFQAFIATTAYLDGLARARAREPQDDLISRLVVTRVHSGELSHDDLVAMIRLMLVAGHETTANQLALSILTMIQRPDVLASLQADSSMMPLVIDELLRYWSIAQDNIVRVAMDDIEFSGSRIRAGDAVIISVPAANLDDKVFPEPEAFDIHRGNSDQNMAFGHGPHHCPGGPLARMEMEIALTTVFERLPGLRLAVDASELSIRPDTLVFGLEELPVTW